MISFINLIQYCTHKQQKYVHPVQDHVAKLAEGKSVLFFHNVTRVWKILQFYFTFDRILFNIFHVDIWSTNISRIIIMDLYLNLN